MGRAKPKKRQILPDPVFGSVKVTRLVNHSMHGDKKSTAFKIFYSALETVKGKLSNREKSAFKIWKAVFDNITPQVKVKSCCIGGATFQVPTEIRSNCKGSIPIKNLIIFARKRGGKTMTDKLFAEIIDVFNNQGGTFKRRENMHRVAEANRASAHFRF